MRGDAWISLPSGLLSLNQGSLLFCNFAGLRVIICCGSFVRSFFSGAFSICLCFRGLLLFLNCLLLGNILFENFDVFGQVLIYSGHGTLLLREEVCLTRKEAEEAVKVVVNTLGLLDTSHEKSIKFVCHLILSLIFCL